MTLKELIIENPNVSLDLMTPGGYVFLTPQHAQELLSGHDVSGNAGASDSSIKISAEELLSQEIVTINTEDNLFHILTESPCEPNLEMGVTMC